MLIQIGDYIKTCTGEIRKIIDIETWDELTVFKMDKRRLLPMYTDDPSKMELMTCIGDDQVIKSNVDIRELLVEGDTIVYRVKGIKNTYIDQIKQYPEGLGVNFYKLEQLEIIQIITEKQFENVGYKVVE